MSGPYGGYGNHPQNPNPQYGPPQQHGPAQQYGPPPQQRGPARREHPDGPPRRGPQEGPPRKRRGNNRPLLLGAVAAAIVGVVAIVAGVLVVPRGGSGGSGTSAGASPTGDSPRTVAQKYIEAGKQGDSATMLTLTCDKDKASVSTASPGANGEGGGGVDYQILDVQQNGDTAVASVKITVSGTSTTQSMPLVNENGGWKVCD